MSVQILWRPLLWNKNRFYFSAMIFGKSLIMDEKYLSFRPTSIPNSGKSKYRHLPNDAHFLDGPEVHLSGSVQTQIEANR